MTTTTETVRSLLTTDHRANADFFRVPSWRDFDPAEDNAIPCGWLESCPEGEADFIGHRYLSGSDYNGGALIRANLKEWDRILSDNGEPEGLSYETPGGMGTDGRVLRLSAPVDDDNREAVSALLETLAGLSGYPVVSDDALSEQEHAEEMEAWDGWARSDFRRALSQALGVEIDNPADEPADADSLFDVFRFACDRANRYVEHDDSGPSFPVDDAAEDIAEDPKALAALFALGMVADVDDIEPEDDADIVRAEGEGRRLKALASLLPPSVDRVRFMLADVAIVDDATMEIRRRAYWPTYSERVALIGATPPLFPLPEGTAFLSTVDPEGLRKALALFYGATA